MHTELSERTAKLEEVQNSNTQSDTQMCLSIPKSFGCSPCNHEFTPFLENKKSQIKANIKHDSKTTKQLIYTQDRKLKENSRKVRLENQTINWQVLLPSL